ncbi:MAG TPA: LysE family transporter [Porticoccaceae bacterium]|nr:LysE family transporter [Porticoccaceae bacterium]
MAVPILDAGPGIGIGEMAAMFVAMAVMAAMPSLSVLTVVSRATAAGLWQGLAVALGIVLADLLFILLAVVGLAVVADAMGEFFGWVKCLGGLYLLWLGITTWRSGVGARRAKELAAPSRASSLGAGFMVTLADHKAMLFYLGFLPAFVDLAALSPGDTLWILLIAAVAVGGVKSAYAVLAWRLGQRIPAAIDGIFIRLASIAMMVVGVSLLGLAILDWR